MRTPWDSRSWTYLTAERVATSALSYALVTLQDPDRRNMMSSEMTMAWRELMECLAEDADLGAVVITGSGSAFCAGGDLSWITESTSMTPAQVQTRMERFYDDWLSVRRLPVPTIAAINGHAVGAGLGLALACDLRLVSASAKLSVPFTHLGIHPGMGTTFLLPEVVGVAVARDLLLTGRAVDGEEALRLHLVSQCLPSGDAALEAAQEAAARVCAASPAATRLTVQTLRNPARGLAEALPREALTQGVTMTGPDVAEGMAAAKAKRPAQFVRQ